jgi:PAS domain S-box-containing protein
MMVGTLISRQTGPLFPLHVAHILFTWCAALYLFAAKWRAARGRVRGELNYLAAGILIPGAGAITTNVLHPLLTGRSTYAWIGPYFGLTFVAIVGHAMIRHRVTDLRLVLHRSLTVGLAAMLSSIPVVILLFFVWPRLFGHLDANELTVVFISICLISLLLPVSGTAGARLLDRYVYRTHTNYQRTVREASTVLTRVLDLRALLKFIVQTVGASTDAEGAGIYLKSDTDFGCAIATRRHDGSHFDAPETAMAEVVEALERLKEPLVTDEIVRAAATEAERELAEQLTQANWSLVLPVISDSGVIALIAVGPKLSGDPFYPQDLDLLMTLANQAGIAIKNARLYAQVVLANEYIENIVATIESGVVAITSAGRVAMFNRAAERLTGLRTEDVKGESIQIVQACVSEPLLATVADGQARTNPESELVAGEVRRPVMSTTSPLRDPDGVVLGAVAVFSDLTPLKELENERRRAERLAYFEILASGIAHEIKNPLVGIKTFTQLVPRRRADDRFIEEFTRVVGREIERMERLLERLGALSRPGRRPQYPLDVRAPIAQVVEAMQPTFDEKGITISTALGNAACLVLGHHAELEQLFLNLVMNAHEATPPGGLVHIDVRQDAQHVTVNISDTGPGIAADLVERVFDPFFSTKQRGSGLGLAICAGIAQTHGARVQADNRPGGGAIFSVEFPAAPQPARVDA